VAGFLRRTIEEVWAMKRLYSFSDVELIINNDPKELRNYANRIGIKVSCLGDKNREIQNKPVWDKNITGKDMLKLINYYNLSVDQVAVLLGVNKSTIWRNSRKTRISPYVFQRLSTFLHRIKEEDIRAIHFEANKLTNKRYDPKDKGWMLAEKYPEVVYIYKAHKDGRDFETKISKILNDNGYETILNTGLFDKKAILRTTKYLEADIFASNGTEKIIVECKKRMTKRKGNVRHQKYVPSISSLSFLKEVLGVDRAIFATLEILSDRQKNLAKRKGIEIWDKDFLTSIS